MLPTQGLINLPSSCERRDQDELSMACSLGAPSTLEPQDAIQHVGCFTEHTPLLLPYSYTSSSSSAKCIDIMVKVRRSKFSQFVDKLAVESEPSLTNAQLMLSNHDLKPVEPERRQWRSRNFVAFWIADSFNINTWMIASASILDGLSWWQAWLCVW